MMIFTLGCNFGIIIIVLTLELDETSSPRHFELLDAGGKREQIDLELSIDEEFVIQQDMHHWKNYNVCPIFTVKHTHTHTHREEL